MASDDTTTGVTAPTRRLDVGDSPLTDQPALPGEIFIHPGERLSRYLVLERLGRGGMAIVYKAFDPKLDRNVAMKVMAPRDGIEDDEARGRFMREAQALARISHPNVIEVYDVGLVDTRAFITMKLVDGSDLREWARERRHHWREILDVYVKAGRGLAAAHAAGLVHRDFKPSNVLIGNDGHVYVTDFGIARLAAAPARDATETTPAPTGLLSSEITRAGTLAGTEGYIAPELYAGNSPDARSDQFSFCVALYAALFGRAPFDPGSSAPAEPETSDVPVWVRRLVIRGLLADPVARFGSMDQLLDALERDPNLVRRRWLAAGAGGIALLGAIAVGVHLSSRDQDLCTGADKHLIGVWDGPARQAAETAFLATNVPFAAKAWRATASVVDDYATSWTRMRTEACAATRVRGDQSDEVLSLRMICLDRRLLELGALVAHLGQADAKMVDKSIQAATALTDVDVCANVASLKDIVRPPEDARTRRVLGEINRLLAQSKARRDSGKFPDGLALARQAAAQSDGLRYPPLEGEVYLALGRLHSDLGQSADARTALLRAFAAAERGHDDRVRAEAATYLAWVQGAQQEQFDASFLWSQVASAILDRLGGDSALELVVLNHRAGVLYAAGMMEELLEHQQRYVKMREERMGPNDIGTAIAILNLGTAHATQGHYDEAKATFDRAIAAFTRIMGPDYFRIGLAENNMADLLTRQGRAAEALALAERAVARIRAGRGPTHPETIASEMTMAFAILGTRDYERAIEFLEPNMERWRSTLSPESGLFPEAAIYLARAYAASGNTERAIAILEPEIATRAAQPEPHPILATLLTELGECQLALGRSDAGLASLERAHQVGVDRKLQPTWLADTKFALAQALRASGRDPARARQLAEEARAIFHRAKMAGEGNVDAWLAVASSQP